MKIYEVIFKQDGIKYDFKSEDEILLNQYVIVDTERGKQYGKVVGIKEFKPSNIEYKNVIRVATDEDNKIYLKNLMLADKALSDCKRIAKELELDLSVVSSSFNFEKTQLLINFVSDERIDFRDLAKKLAYIYKTRIELRQIGPRDKAKEIGGIGICGQQLCCLRFLKKMETISINMAKNQRIVLNPNKINGGCGRLLCCLEYEDPVYSEMMWGLPNIGDQIETEKGKGRVINVDILNRKVIVSLKDEKITIQM